MDLRLVDVLDLNNLPADKLRALDERQRRAVREAQAEASGGPLFLNYQSGPVPQKAQHTMKLSPEKERQLLALSCYVELTDNDRTAALVLTADELDACKWCKVSPAEMLETKRLQAQSA